MFQNMYNIYNNNSVKLSSQTLKNNLNVEIKYMRSLVIYAIIFNFLVLFYYSDKILELFVNTIWTDNYTPKFWVGDFKEPFKIQLLFCLKLTICIWLISSITLMLIFIVPGLFYHEVFWLVTVFTANVIVFVIAFLLVWFILYPITIQFFIHNPTTSLIEKSKFLDPKGFNLFGQTEIIDYQPILSQTIEPLFHLILLVWFILIIPITFLITLLYKINNATFNNPLNFKHNRLLSYSFLALSSALISPPDIPYQITLTFSFIIIYEIKIHFSILISWSRQEDKSLFNISNV